MFKKVIKEEWKFPADIDHLGQMRDTVTRYGRKYGVSERELNAFKLAIDEAGTNIIRHAYRDWEGDITIRMIIREKTVTISLIDQGHSFDMRHVQDPDLQRYVDIGKKGGLGIFIIRRVIDTIDYRKTLSGNELRLTKKRQVGAIKKLGVPEVPISMKTRFSLYASLIFTGIVLFFSILEYINHDHRIKDSYLIQGKAIARSVAGQSLENLAAGYTFNLFEIARKFYDEHQREVSEILILDTAQTIQGAAVLGTESALRFFRHPKIIKDIEPQITLCQISNQYRIVDDVLFYEFSKKIKPKKIYNVTIPVVNTIADVPVQLGKVLLFIEKSHIDQEVNQAKRATLFRFLVVLGGGWLGIFGLVYITMAPFKRLSLWISDLGHGEVHDEMEFNTDDEIGEIAQAFNEITSKFRKSQENLAEQERLQKEMQVAQEIQHTLLPASFPKIEGYEIASYYEAAKEVGGDYFDFVEVDRDTLGIVVADVSGKGVPGSLVMTMIRTALRTEARGNKNAADVLSRVNDFVINDMKRGMFVTIFYIILDSKRRSINYASAGHNPMILYRGQTQKSYYLNPRGFPIGINLPDKDLFRTSIESDNIQLREDDVLIVYTDGITEAMDTNRERFGDERFLSVIRKNGGLKIEPVVEKIQQEINTFTGGHPQSDDITLVGIREKMSVDEVMFNLRNRLMNLVTIEKKSVKEACQIVGVSTSTYYKYKKRFDTQGEEGLRETVKRTDIEEKHIAIEDKAKIFDIIKNNPELGPKKIQEELLGDKYGNMNIDESRIYEELVRSRLNTKKLRLAFVEKGDQGRRMKPPGTPLLTLDGKIIIEEPKPKEPLQPIVAEKDYGQTKTTSFQNDNNVIDQEKRELTPTTPDADTRIDEKEPSDVPDDFLKFDTDEENILGIHEITDTVDDVMDVVTDIERFLVEDIGSQIKEPKEGKSQIDDILESEVFIPGWDELSPIEEDITGFSADSLLDEALDPLSPERMQETVSEKEGYFSGMLDELGFDAETGKVGGAVTKKNIQQDVHRINAKRYEESGKLFYREGFYAKAIEEFQKVIRINPQNPEIFQCLGDTYFRLGQLNKAKEAYENVRNLDPKNIQVLENLGVVFANQGEYKKAVWQWGEVLKINPNRYDIVERIKRMQRVIRQRSV